MVKLAKVEAKLNKQDLAEAQAEKELLDAQEECAAEIDSQLGGAGGYLAGAGVRDSCGDVPYRRRQDSKERGRGCPC